jgi:hypothetical protein
MDRQTNMNTTLSKGRKGITECSQSCKQRNVACARLPAAHAHHISFIIIIIIRCLPAVAPPAVAVDVTTAAGKEPRQSGKKWLFTQWGI